VNIQSSSAAVITHSHVSDVRYSVVVNVVDDGGVHVIDAAIVVELIAAPIAAFVAAAHVAETIVHSAIEADVRAPVAVIPVIAVARVAPVRRSPKRTNIGRDNPDAGNPIVSGLRVAPIAGRPQVIWAGSGWLAVFRQRGRRFGRFNGRFTRIVVFGNRVGVVIGLFLIVLI
jgi:hypothetical protein